MESHVPVLGPATQAATGVGSDGQQLGPVGRALAAGTAILDATGGAEAPAVDIAAGRAALSDLMAGEFRVMAGSGSGKAFRAAANLGGNAADWAYVTSTQVWEHGGYRYQAHWAENLLTGERAMAKLKLLGPAQ